MPLYLLDEPTEPLVAPVMVAAFDAWIDAGGASTTACSLIASPADVIATFDADALFDYRARRPVLDIVDGTLAELAWPSLVLKRARHGGRDLLVLSGPEPDFRWQELGQDLHALALQLGVVEWVSLGAIPAAVPHTRPVPILATASRPGLLREDENQGPEGLLRVPAAALSTIELTVSSSGIPAVGFFAQVPHYVSGPFAAATIAILEHAGRHVGAEFPLGSLPDEAATQRQRLDNLVASDPETQTYLERLEAIVDEQRIPSGDELASEIERFLSGETGPSEPGHGPLGGR
jgi:hypothetical protein